jgi:hypothetical protein
MDQSSTIFELSNQIDMRLLKLKRQQGGFGVSKTEEQTKLSHEQRMKERDATEIEARTKLGGCGGAAGDNTRNKIEFMTMFTLAGMFKKNQAGLNFGDFLKKQQQGQTGGASSIFTKGSQSAGKKSSSSN